jgi:DNA-binding response OmpR family regulator
LEYFSVENTNVMPREKILVVDADLDSLSRIYLALIHRRFKTEACNDPHEIPERLKRFKPAVIVLGIKDYGTLSQKLKIPAIVLAEKDDQSTIELNYGDIHLKKPVHAEQLIKTVEMLV